MKIQSNKQGSALVLSLIVLLVASLLGAVLLSVSLTENKHAIIINDAHRAYYIAKAGSEAAAAWVSEPSSNTVNRDIDTVINPLLTNNQDNTEITPFGGGEFVVKFLSMGNKYTPVIESTGRYNNSTRKVTVALKKKYLFQTAVSVKDTLTIGNKNVSIIGDVAVPNESSLVLPGVTADEIIDGNVYYVVQDFPAPVDPLFPFQSWPTSNMISSTDTTMVNRNYDAVNLNAATINIYLNGKMEIQFDELSSTNATINVHGTGNLIIYVNSFAFKGNLYTDSTATTTFMVFNEGTVTYKTGSSIFQGFIYGPNADITMTANSVVDGGFIVARNLTMESGSELEYHTTYGNAYPELYGFLSRGYDKVMVSD